MMQRPFQHGPLPSSQLQGLTWLEASSGPSCFVLKCNMGLPEVLAQPSHSTGQHGWDVTACVEGTRHAPRR